MHDRKVFLVHFYQMMKQVVKCWLIFILIPLLCPVDSQDIKCDKPNQVYYDPDKPDDVCVMGCKAGESGELF